MQRGASGGKRCCLGTQHILREMLTRIHRQLALGDEFSGGCRPRTLRRVHASSLSDRALEYPVWQWRAGQGLARVNVFLNHQGHLQPARLLPQLERALLGTKAPAHCKVNVTRSFGNGLQMHGGVMKLVTQYGPQKAGFCAFGIAQQLQAFARRLFQHAAHHVVGLGTAGNVFHTFRVKPQDVASDLFIKASAGFLTQTFGLQQPGQHRRRAVHAGKWVGRFAFTFTQIVLQRFDHMRHGVQTDHISGAESARTGTTQFFTCQIIDHVIRQAKSFSLLDDGQHAGNTDAVGNEIGRVVCANDILAQTAGDECFQVVQHRRAGGRCVDQLDQRHVARRVEKVDAAKARLD